MNIMTPVFRVSYPNVVKPKMNKMSGKMEYSAEAIFPKGADLTALKKAAQAAIMEKWGAKAEALIKQGKIRTPFRDQGEKTKIDETTGKETLPQPYEKGAIFIRMKSDHKPGVVDENVQDIIDDSAFYAGCYARATVRCYAYEQAGNLGVAFGLQNIQKVKDGDALGSRTKAQDDFAPIGMPETGGAPADATSLFT